MPVEYVNNKGISLGLVIVVEAKSITWIWYCHKEYFPLAAMKVVPIIQKYLTVLMDKETKISFTLSNI